MASLSDQLLSTLDIIGEGEARGGPSAVSQLLEHRQRMKSAPIGEFVPLKNSAKPNTMTIQNIEDSAVSAPTYWKSGSGSGKGKSSSKGKGALKVSGPKAIQKPPRKIQARRAGGVDFSERYETKAQKKSGRTSRKLEIKYGK